MSISCLYRRRTVLFLIFFFLSFTLIVSTIIDTSGFFSQAVAKSVGRSKPTSPMDISKVQALKKFRNKEVQNETVPPSPSSPLQPEISTKSVTGALTVKKIIANNGGGNKKPSDFTINVDGNNPTPQSFPGSSSGTLVELDSGKYSVSETGPASYNSSQSTGCSGLIKPGEDKKCTITNTYSKPVPPTAPITTAKLVVTKKVINNGGGNKKPSDFTINVDGNNPTPQSFPGSSSGTLVELDSGKYSVSETGPASYNSSQSTGCSGLIKPGEDKKCTITNIYSKLIPPPVVGAKLVVTKKVINNGGGNKKPSDFTINVDGNNPTPQSFPGSSVGSTVKLLPGKYQVSEQGPISSQFVPGTYTPSYSAECDGLIKSGETNNCIITNKFNPFIPGLLSKLVVTKRVINDGGGNKKPSDFTITVHGNNPSPGSFPGSSSGTSVQLRTGTYSITETGPTFRYTTDYSKDCTGNASPNSIKRCYITNVYQEPGPTSKLIVIKNIINNNNPSGSFNNKKPSDFAITVHGNNPSPRSFQGKSGSGVSVSIYPGRYSVTEKTQSGYSVDYSPDCEDSIRSGQTKVCIITNVALKQSLPIIVTQPIIKNITGFSSPYGVATDTDNSNVYVSNYGKFNASSTVSIINSTTNTITSSIPVGKNPQAIAYNSANRLVYVANLLSDTISVINSSANNVIGSISFGKSPGNSPNGIAINSINNTLYAINPGSNTVSVIDGTNNILKGNLVGYFNPSGVAYNVDNDAIYITNKGTNTISIINSTNYSLKKTIPSGGALPSAIIYNAANGLVYTCNSGSNTVSVLNTTTDSIVGVVSVGVSPNGITFNPINGNVYVANSMSGTISIINGISNTVSKTIITGNTPIGLSYNPSNRALYVANFGSNNVSVVTDNNP